MKEKIIIGSGLSGPLLALYLNQKDYKVTLFEKRSDLRKEKTSAGRSINLALSERGINALKEVNVYDEIKNELLPMKGRMIHDIDGKTQFQSYSINENDYINSVSRNKLNEILLNKVEESSNVKIYFNHSLDKIEKDLLFFKNNIKYNINNNIIFGTDGFNSKVRDHIDSKNENKTKIDYLGHSYKELNISSDKKNLFQLKENVLHIWPRNDFMLIALPNTDRSFTCTLFLSNKGKISFDSLKSNDDVKKFFKKYFHDIYYLLDDFPNSFFTNPTSNLGSIKTTKWNYENKFCILGDAAHAIVPFFGQGMNASFEDCSVLMYYCNKYEHDWDKIISTFCKKRLIDTNAISQMALDNYIEMRNSVSKNKYKKRKEISDRLYKTFPKLFIPKYNMVSFTSIPYNEVYKKSFLHNKILDELENNYSDSKALELINKYLL
ncbi:MAG: kynurenine 3-monooxygenase [Candidatus Marinimicrobia bacterium]|nr:kynurenine 3-monooxygenase [Candidatus Neomarinimicrobiota bacterium]